jgi:hypothetical protein
MPISVALCPLDTNPLRNGRKTRIYTRSPLTDLNCHPTEWPKTLLWLGGPASML